MKSEQKRQLAIQQEMMRKEPQSPFVAPEDRPFPDAFYDEMKNAYFPSRRRLYMDQIRYEGFYDETKGEFLCNEFNWNEDENQ